MAEFTCH